MEIGIILLVIIIGVVLYLTKDRWSSTTPQNYKQNLIQQRLGRKEEIQPFLSSAEMLVRQGKYDDAATLYLQAGRIFQAAKTKMLKGPEAAFEAIEIIRNRMPLQFEKIGRNLAHEFFYNQNKPKEAAAILRAMGLNDEATAVEVAAGISSPQVQTPRFQEQATTVEPVPVTIEKKEISMPKQVHAASIEPVVEMQVEEQEELTPENIPDTALTAQKELDHPCVVCKRKITVGEVFIYCLNCGKPGHSKHLLEYTKVRGICPNCKKRLTPNMYSL